MEKQKSFLEVINSEKQMLALIYSKNILHDDVLVLYRKIRSGYEEMLLNSNQLVEHQEVEYHLWKLHYELIDGFRKKIRQQSCNAENMKNCNPYSQINSDKGLEGFKLFLSEATDFYKKLIVKLRKRCGLPAEIFLNNKDYRSFDVEPIKMHACQHTCHRLLICVGDLARYTEIVKKPDACEWSTAATYYLEATRTWPDSGNPHNQLALLATYVGDAFLALYHCVRSLAVKEPFPDAWRNIMLLSEENRCTKLPSVSYQIQLDLLNPSKRSYVQNSRLEGNSSPHNSKLDDLETVTSETIELWPILVRTISFLLIRSGLEEFQQILALALHKLEALLAVDDTNLTAILESYHHMDFSKRGPYRAIQLVSIFIFTVDALTDSPEREDSTEKDDQKCSVFTPLAFAAIFIFMGRIIERCLKGNNHGDICPLLPAVLVFLEWLEGALDTVETHNADERVANALSYFYGSLADLLDRIKSNDGNWTDLDYTTALWEDHELKGFYPLNRVHETMDFAAHLECMEDYKSRNHCRCKRILHAAARIMDTSKNDKGGRRFKSMKKVRFSDQSDAASVSRHESNETDEQTDRSLKDNDQKPLNEEIAGPKTSLATEEEEIILFKPITRRNSAPLYISKPAKGPSTTCPEGPTINSLADEYLRRATSLSTCQVSEYDPSDSFSFCPTTSKQKELTGPPSLSGWVLSKEASSNTESNNFSRQNLSPVEEITDPTSFFDLSINEKTKDKSEVATGHHISTIVHDSSPRVTPTTPSAPLLPDDAYWLKGNNNNNSIGGNEGADGILGAGPISGYPTRLGVSGLVDGYPPFLGMMSSSEWLYHYRNGQNMNNNNIAGNHHHLLAPVHLNNNNISPPAFGNFHANNNISGFDLCDQWGNHWVSNPMLYLGGPQMHPDSGIGYYGDEGQKRDKLFAGYQRPFPYVCGVGMELSPEQPPLLQYLKEKERQLQPGSQLRGPPTFMGN